LWDWWRSRSSRLSWNTEGWASQIQSTLGFCACGLILQIRSHGSIWTVASIAECSCDENLRVLLQLFWIKWISQGVYLYLYCLCWIHARVYLFSGSLCMNYSWRCLLRKGYKDCFLTTLAIGARALPLVTYLRYILFKFRFVMNKFVPLTITVWWEKIYFISMSITKGICITPNTCLLLPLFQIIRCFGFF
jgi:hypothetical protein